MEIGDSFIIINSKKSKRGGYLCKDPDKTFIIKDFSKSNISVYYEDNRTNNKCRCNNCKFYSNAYEKLKCIGVRDIQIVETKQQRDRNLKLNRIL